MRPALFEHPPLEGYALLDSGEGRKLERFGEVVLDRPDPQALWRPRLQPAEWARADLAFERESDRGGRWRALEGAHALARGREPAWELALDGARFRIVPTPFKHVGLFPEQACNWRWLSERVGELPSEPQPRLLNLFAYTGAASIFAARAGFAVTHVDASRASLDWSRENAERSGVPGGSLRWILEDALTFARREVRRGSRYAGIVLDPPHHGRGPKGERWQLEEGLAPLLEACAELLDERAFLVLSLYAVGHSPLALANLVGELGAGRVEAGELALPEGDGARALPAGFCARWARGLGE